jgi:alanyl-tRNA synthetase
MDSQLLYQEDPARLVFEAQVVEVLSLQDGRTGLVLDRTYFYPTGGGQEHDTGMLGSARVVDVFKDEAHSRLVHVIEGEVNLGPVSAHIDAERRLRHMQHHTAQHLLSQCLLKVTGFETVSANINGYTPSALDVIADQVSKAHLDQAEELANQVIYENRQVKTYFVTPNELNTIQLRKPPKVSENIRIVEIDAFDYSACGGTHVAYTGSIGLLKVLKAERQNDKQRIYFIAGMQAMQLFHQMYDSLNHLSTQHSTSWQEIPNLFTKQADQLTALQKELQSLRMQMIKYEARDLVEMAIPSGKIRLLRSSFDNRPVAELRLLAEQLKKVPDLVSFLTSYDGQKVALLVTCGEQTALDARQVLGQQISRLNGRGGGEARLAQGGATAAPEEYRQFLQKLAL